MVYRHGNKMLTISRSSAKASRKVLKSPGASYNTWIENTKTCVPVGCLARRLTTSRGRGINATRFRLSCDEHLNLHWCTNWAITGGYISKRGRPKCSVLSIYFRWVAPLLVARLQCRQLVQRRRDNTELLNILRVKMRATLSAIGRGHAVEMV